MAALKIHDRVLAVAERFPQHDACVSGGARLSYAEFSEQLLALASLLGSLRMNVGLYTGKCTEAVVAIYAILKAGAAYVPLDTNSPRARLAFIARQASIECWICTSKQRAALLELLGEVGGKHRVIVFDWASSQRSSETCSTAVRAWRIDEQQVNCGLVPMPSQDQPPAHAKQYRAIAEESLTVDVSPTANRESLAAILYTSGSTGQPKGVLISHAAISVFTEWAHAYFELRASDRVASHAPLHFDLSLFDLFASHIAGATVVLLPESYSSNPKYIAKFIGAERITVWQSVPSVLSMLVRYGDLAASELRGLRHVLFAGEVPNPQDIKCLAGQVINANLHNIYGCTETNNSFIYSFTGASWDASQPIPIGRPLPYVEFKVVTDDGEIAVTGQRGELYVKTPTMMLGYRQDPHAGSHAASHAMPVVGDDYYRTKDVVYIAPSGMLEFIGRTDNIVKIGGNRVSLVEVESCLSRHPAVGEYAAACYADAEGNRKIVAFLHCPQSAAPSAVALKLFCSTHLPKYAIPSAFVVKPTPLPKTSSGKVNKQQLLSEGALCR
jgi:amino acid adenylation domain-containing protein